MTQVNDLQILKTAFIVNQLLDKEKCIQGMFCIMFYKGRLEQNPVSFTC